MNISLRKLQSWVSSVDIGGDAELGGVTTDSRNVVAGDLFVALRGERFDAHDFLAEVAAKGAAAVVVDRVPDAIGMPYLRVPDTRIALGEIARGWRSQFALPVIGVTGSNGKTTVKEMIAAILHEAFGKAGYLATRGNLNNEVGVPLTLLRLSEAHHAAVVEMGMNHVGEIAWLASVAQPTIALVNNAQREHQEFMQSIEAVARENGAVIEALPDNGVAVFPADDEFTPMWRALATANGARTVVTFGLNEHADVTCSYRDRDFGSDVTLDIQGRKVSVKLMAAGLHNVRNAMAAAACCCSLGIDAETIAQGLTAFMPVNGRMQRKQAVNGATVIDDTYNANPDSVLAAINVLAKTVAPRILVLGDMGEVGSDGVHFHEEVGTHAAQSGIDRMLTLGELARHASAAFGANGEHFNTLEDLMQALGVALTSDATVLVKGSRFMQMERVVHQLLNEPMEGSH